MTGLSKDERSYEATRLRASVTRSSSQIGLKRKSAPNIFQLGRHVGFH